MAGPSSFLNQPYPCSPGAEAMPHPVRDEDSGAPIPGFGGGVGRAEPARAAFDARHGRLWLPARRAQ